MGKSYKKTPSCRLADGWGSKRQANKKVRQLLKNLDVSLSQAGFRKVYDSWNIIDYKEIAPSVVTFIKKNKIRHRQGIHIEHTDDELIQMYRRWYVRK